MIAIIFDLDGTLVALHHDSRLLEQVRDSTFQCISNSIGQPPTRSIFGMYSWACKNSGRDSKLIAQLRKILDEYEAKATEIAKGVAIGAQALSWVKLRQAFVALVTNNGRRCIESLNQRGILKVDLFDKIVSRDDVWLIKPNPEPIQAVLVQRQVDRVIIIGDSPDDEELAKNYNACAKVDTQFLKINPKEHFTQLEHSLATMLPTYLCREIYSKYLEEGKIS